MAGTSGIPHVGVRICPRNWLRQPTVPLHKKGSTQDCDNYRDTALLSVPGKGLLQGHPEEDSRES